MIDINNLSFKLKNKIIFDNLNIQIKNNLFVSIIGSIGSGKTTFAKILAGKYTCDIKLNDEKIDKKSIGVVFNLFDYEFTKEIVKDELKSIDNNLIKKLDIEDILNYNIEDLNNNQKQLVIFAKIIMSKPKIIVIDDALILLDPFVKDKIVNILKKLKDTTVINITHDIEDTLFSDYIYILDQGKIILKGTKKKIYEEEDRLYSVGYKLPFMVELSNRMKFYNLIDKDTYNMEEMVNLLWK